MVIHSVFSVLFDFSSFIIYLVNLFFNFLHEIILHLSHILQKFHLDLFYSFSYYLEKGMNYLTVYALLDPSNF